MGRARPCRTRSHSCARRTSRRNASCGSTAASRATSTGARTPTCPTRCTSTASTRRRSTPGSSGRRAAAPSSPGLVVGSQAGERTLDLCAAPGGKATQLAGEVVAVELHSGRARELEENCRRLGADNVTVVNADARALPPELTGFDRVLVDSPCSGLGVLAARPDLRWRAEPLPELQTELLRVAAERVKPGGTILYSVCTMNTEENEAIVDATGLKVDSLGDEWPQFRHPRRPEFLLTLPHVHGTSGFFIARLTT